MQIFPDDSPNFQIYLGFGKQIMISMSFIYFLKGIGISCFNESETRVVCLFIHKAFLTSEKDEKIFFLIELYFENFFLQENTILSEIFGSQNSHRVFSLKIFIGDAIHSFLVTPFSNLDFEHLSDWD